jgi:hypothetical protein
MPETLLISEDKRNEIIITPIRNNESPGYNLQAAKLIPGPVT